MIPKIKVQLKKSGNGFVFRVKKALVDQEILTVEKTYEIDTMPVKPNGKRGKK